MAYIEAKGIHKTFGKGDGAVHALRGASLSVDKGEMVAVMGKSGSGKSTLLNILGGLMTMDEGELYVGGKAVNFRKKKFLLNYRRKEVGFVVQYFALIDDMNIYRNVSLPLKYQGMSGSRIRKRTSRMLKKLGIAEGTSLAYLVSTPVESTYALDKALKASQTKIAEMFYPPTRVNTGGGVLVGTESACRAAVQTFAEAVEYCAFHPMEVE